MKDMRVPRHVAVIMDGNGRWGKAHGLSRSEGHYAGVEAMENVIDASIQVGVEALTLYAFSTENWSRAKDEVKYLMYLPVKFFEAKVPEFMRRNIKIIVSGDLADVPKMTRNAIERAIEKTSLNTGLVVNFAFNYGGRLELVHAVRAMARDGVLTDSVTEADVYRYLYTRDLPALDLMIRTGGEQRLSNFLLWQVADAELYFSKDLFPDFGMKAFKEAVHEWRVRTYAHSWQDDIALDLI